MKLISKRKLLGIFLVLMGTSPLVLALDNAHFYKPANFEGIRSHDTADWVNKTNLRLGYGSTRSGYNYKSNKTSLLDIYGNQNLLYLITNVPQKSGQAVTEHLTNLAKLSNHSQTNSDFGNLKFSGKFTLLEGNIDIRQNLVEGFFIEGHLPIRKVKVENISYDDLSPTTGRYSQTTGEWIQLKQQLNNLLNIYGLKNYETVYDKTGLGDLSFSIGWQYEDKNTFEFLQFLSIAIRLGLLIPTGKKADTSYAFPIPTGYNGHWGLPINLDLNIGAADWLTIGLYGGVQFFFDKTYNNRMKTNKNQSGFIKLAEGDAKVDKGTLWDFGADLLFDHFFRGLSALAGYSFNSKESDSLTPSNTTEFSSSILDSDTAYYTWKQHIIHLMVEYDFGVHLKDKMWGARINAFFDFPIGGKNIFATSMYTGGIELDFQF